jgi:hypothetical protein
MAKMNLIYSPTKQAKELEAMAEIWFDNLGWMETDVFVKAIDRHITEGRWFPAPADIRAHYWAAKAEATATTQAKLPPPSALTDEQKERWNEGIQSMRAAVAAAKRKARIAVQN